MKNVKEKKKNNKKINIIFFFILMIIALYLFEQLMYQLYPIIARMIIYGKFGKQVIIEGVCAIIILIVLLLFKNSYVFTEKKQGFIHSIMTGGFVLILAMTLLGVSINSLNGSVNILDIGSLALYCLLIGIFEEFLCRGWIQNEFIERFANNRKQIILSIFLSSLIFGGMHITNIWIGGQSIIDTISQIIQASGMGFLLGTIYFRTKNIWSVIFLHGFWDFALFLGEINTIKECTQGTPTKEYQLCILAAALLFSILYVIIGLYILRKSKTQGLIEGEELTEEELKKSKKSSKFYIILAILVYVGMSYIPVPEIEETCYEYTTKELYYTNITYPLYEEYTITQNDININVSLTDNKLIFSNPNTKETMTFNKEYVDSFVIIKDNDTYKIAIIALNEYQTDTEIWYSEFITNENISNDKEYLQEINKSFIKLDKAPTTDNLAIINANNKDYIVLENSSQILLVIDNNDIFKLKRLTSEPIEETTKDIKTVTKETTIIEDMTEEIMDQMTKQGE